jgi:TetR/AcrR family transcriptional regulator, mexJK operon transcriptional repressor
LSSVVAATCAAQIAGAESGRAGLSTVKGGKSRLGGRPTHREAEERMTRLLDVAQRQFLATGYRETSLDKIAGAAGIAKKTLYRHFDSKAGLFAAILGRLRDAWISELRGIVLVSDQPEQVLRAVALHLLDVGTRREMLELQRLLLLEAHRFPDLARSIYDQNGSLRGMEPLLSYFRAAVAEGVLKIDDVALATEQFSFLVLGGIREQLLLGAARRPGATERQRISRQAVHIFLAGCRA